jgi:thymidylate synthase
MFHLNARNVHHALPMSIPMLKEHGVRRDSRNGPVLVMPTPVTTTYQRPEEKLLWWPERDVNVAFLVFEALWMLAGRNDVEPLTRYVKDFGKYSNDGKTLHGAYGYRWRRHFGFDQLETAIGRLKHNAEDRRTVVAMWDPESDLAVDDVIKDIPCNDAIAFQRGANGELNMDVFCRSNDMLFGAYFANAFHFAALLEYMALRIGCPVGVYRQISINFHAYEATFTEMVQGVADRVKEGASDLYALDEMPVPPASLRGAFAETIDDEIGHVVRLAVDQLLRDATLQDPGLSAPMQAAVRVLRAHEIYRHLPEPERFEQALRCVEYSTDWDHAMRAWLKRRLQSWEAKMRA